MSDAETPHPLHQLGEVWLRFGERFLATSASLPETGSQFYPDQARARDFNPGMISSSKLASAYDAARALSLLWHAGHVHLVADYALLRAVLECSAQVWWILAAPDADERIRRSYRVVIDDLRQALNRENNAVRLALEEESREKRRAVARRVNITMTDRLRAFRESGVPATPDTDRPRNLEMLSLLQEAQEAMPDVPDVGFTLLWSMLSSLAHGSPTSVEQAASSGPRPPGLSPQVGYLESDPEMVLQFASSTAVLLKAADDMWRRYAGYQML